MENERSPARTAGRILLVEDSEDLRTLMVLLLESEGYWVDGAASAAEALERLDRNRYDLIISDYALPGQSGAWLLREALGRSLLPASCALIVTAHPNPPDAGEFEVIHKPLEFDAFLARIRWLLARCEVRERRARPRPN